MEQKIKWLLPDVEILLFKSWDQIPYDNVSPSKEVQIERLKTLKILSNSKAKRIILTTINSITQKIILNQLLIHNFLKFQKIKNLNLRILSITLSFRLLKELL